MKKIVNLALIALFLVSSTVAFSQGKAKFGHIDSQKLLSEMPEVAEARKALENYTKGIESELLKMQTELQSKYKEYEANQSTYDDVIKKAKEDEITGIQERIQKFQTNAQQGMQNKEAELLQPVITKAKDAIKAVAKDKGYTYVFDTSTGGLAYWPEEADNIMDLVKAKLAKK